MTKIAREKHDCRALIYFEDLKEFALLFLREMNKNTMPTVMIICAIPDMPEIAADNPLEISNSNACKIPLTKSITIINGKPILYVIIKYLNCFCSAILVIMLKIAMIRNKKQPKTNRCKWVNAKVVFPEKGRNFVNSL